MPLGGARIGKERGSTDREEGVQELAPGVLKGNSRSEMNIELAVVGGPAAPRLLERNWIAAVNDPPSQLVLLFAVHHRCAPSRAVEHLRPIVPNVPHRWVAGHGSTHGNDLSSECANIDGPVERQQTRMEEPPVQ